MTLAMTQTRVVALLSGDLLFGSQVEAALRPAGVAVANSADPEMLPEAPLLLVDLNSRVEERLEAISRLRERDPETTIVGFCSHEADEIRRRAKVAGANQVVANRVLGKAAARLAAAADLSEPAADER